jgi:2-aminobenzoate-CoA ligase
LNGINKPAFVFRNATLTRGELKRRALVVAAQLRSDGVRPGDRVALRLPNGPEFVVAWHAVHRLGAIAVQLPPLYRRREIERILTDSGAVVMLAEHTFRLDEIPLSRTDPPQYAWRSDEPVMITYIAAADGPLRGVVTTSADLHEAFLAYAKGVLNLGPDDVCVGALGLGWAYGFGALIAFPHFANATSVIVDKVDALQAAIEQHAATILFGVPTIYRMLLRHPQFDRRCFRSLRCCVSAGEPLPATVAEEWRERTGLELLNGLGTTELTHIVISARPGRTRPEFIGQPVDRYEARIIDAEGNWVADGQRGLLVVRGPTRARYWGDADAKPAFCDDWTLTGDLAIRHPDGWFQHVRRADSLIVSAGYKISSREVEAALADHPDVTAARVEGRPDPIRGASIHAFVTPSPAVDRRTLPQRLGDYLKTELAPFKCPRTIEIE